MVARQWFKYRIGAAHTPDTAEYLGLEVPQALLWGGQGDDGGSGAGDLLQGRNEASRRYVTPPPEFYVPAADAWRSTPEDSKQGSGALGTDSGAEATCRLLATIERGIAEYEWALAQGICAEQARLFLPAYGLMTVWRWTSSVQAVAHPQAASGRRRPGRDPALRRGGARPDAAPLSALPGPSLPGVSSRTARLQRAYAPRLARGARPAAPVARAAGASSGSGRRCAGGGGRPGAAPGPPGCSRLCTGRKSSR